LFYIVSRIEAKSEVNKFDIELDVNTEIYPMEKDAHYAMVLATSLNQDGSEEFDIFTYMNEGTSGGLSSLLDEYQYVVHGKVFKQNINKEKM
jgi:DNA-directed RNA polymerase I, II, and III subunit RPABC3